MRTARVPLPAGLIAILALAPLAALWTGWCGGLFPGARAMVSETDVSFTVTQTPAATGQTVVANSAVSFAVSGQVNFGGGFAALQFVFNYPAGLAFDSATGATCPASAAPLVCTYSPLPAGQLPPLTLSFHATAGFTTAPTQVSVRYSPSDPSPDYATPGPGNDDQFVGAGTINVSPYGAATKLAFTQQPSSGTVNVAFATQPVVAVQDANSVTVANDTRQVTLALLLGPGVLSCTGGTTIAAVAGVATFAGCKVDAPGTYQLLALPTAGGIAQATGNSFVVAIPAGAPAKLGFLTQPSGGTLGVAFATQPSVAVQDSNGVTIAGDTRQVTLAKASGPGTLTCTNAGGLTVSAVNGVATFSGCSVSAAGSYQLSATASPLTQAISTAFNVAAPPGPAARLAFVAQPASGITGVAFATQPQVAVQDANGVTVTTDNSTEVLLTAVGGTGSLTCSGTVPKRSVQNGVASFAGCSIDQAGATYQLLATSTPAYTQAPPTTVFAVTSFGAATKLAYTVQPGGGPMGAVWAIQPSVAVQDANGLTVATDASTITLQVVSGPPGGVLSCTGGNSKAAVSGVAAFAGCKLSVQGGYVIRAISSAAYTQVDSLPVTIGGPGPAQTAQLVVVVPTPPGPVPRSRLTFSGTTGTLTATAATFVIQRSGDSKYWNGAVGDWVATLYENPAISGTPATTWTYSVTGPARRLFANTVVSVEFRGIIATVPNASAVDVTMVIR